MKTIEPHFSIIIPTFNRAQLLLSSVKSILKQDNASFEIVIVDDGGDDNTAQVIKELNDVRVHYIKTENRERGAARNSGLMLAQGVYVNYFDSDDIYNSCLSELYQFILNNNSPNVIYGLIENITDKGSSIEIHEPRYPTLKKNLLHNNFMACGSVFVKREIAVNYLFSEDRRLSGTEDWELWLRLYADFDFIKFPMVIFKQRNHSSRSLADVSAARVTERETVFIDHIHHHHQSLSARFSKSELDLFVADRNTLIALANCVSGSKKQAVEYLKRASGTSLWVLTRKRFWAVLKKLIID